MYSIIRFAETKFDFLAVGLKGVRLRAKNIPNMTGWIGQKEFFLRLFL